MSGPEIDRRSEKIDRGWGTWMRRQGGGMCSSADTQEREVQGRPAYERNHPTSRGDICVSVERAGKDRRQFGEGEEAWGIG